MSVRRRRLPATVWTRVIVGFRGGAARTRLVERVAERLTVAQRHLLESRFAPVV
ncbi:MAG: hypothetical protein ACXVEU_01910 [Nocardioidaceae bacterium]